MKKLILVLVLFMLAAAAPGRGLERIRDFGDDPGRLRMFIHTPANVDSTKQYPLVCILHGSMLSAYSMKHCGGWNTLADSRGVYLLYPEQRFTNNIVRAFSVHFNRNGEKLRAETRSIRNMIHYMLEHYPLDRQEVYITGLSAGASMSHVMLYAFPDLFRAAALIAAPATMPLDTVSLSSPLPRVAVIQGERDRMVPPENADAIMRRWRKAYGFSREHVDTLRDYLGNTDLTAYRYEKDGRISLIRIDADRTGHQMLIDPGPSPQEGGRRCIYSKDIDFYLPGWIMDFFGLTGS